MLWLLWHRDALHLPPHPVLSPADSLAPCCCQVKWAPCARCHTNHRRLAPGVIVHFPGAGRKHGGLCLISLTFCNATGEDMCQAAEELKYQAYSDSLFTVLSRITVWLHTPPLSRDVSDVEAEWKASSYSTCTRTCIVQMLTQTRMTSGRPWHLKKINDITQQILREVSRKRKQAELWKRKTGKVCP